MLILKRERVSVHPLILTCLAMFAFAANSVLCRLALGGELVDPASYTHRCSVDGRRRPRLGDLIAARQIKRRSDGGILFVGEPLTLQLIIAGLATLGGIAMVINSKRVAIREEA